MGEQIFDNEIPSQSNRWFIISFIRHNKNKGNLGKNRTLQFIQKSQGTSFFLKNPKRKKRTLAVQAGNNNPKEKEKSELPLAIFLGSGRRKFVFGSFLRLFGCWVRLVLEEVSALDLNISLIKRSL